MAGQTMSRYDYIKSLEISKENYPFYALIMAAMRQADDENLEKLTKCWPDVWVELKARYNAPGGILPEDKD